MLSLKTLSKKWSKKKFSSFIGRVVKTKLSKVFFVTFFLFSLYFFLFIDRVYPNVFVAESHLGGKTVQQATSLLEKETVVPKEIVFSFEENTFPLPLSPLGFSYNHEKTARRAFSLFHTGNSFYDFYRRTIALFSKTRLGLDFDLEEEKLRQEVSSILDKITVEAIYPKAEYVSGEIIIEEGQKGSTVDFAKLRADVSRILSYQKEASIEIVPTEIDPTLSGEEKETLKKRAEQLIGKSLNLTFEYDEFVYKTNNLLAFLGTKGEYNETEIESAVEGVAQKLDRTPQDPVFIFDEGRVKEFSPAKEGVEVDKETLKEMIIGNLRTLERADDETVSLIIPVKTTPSSIKTEEVNNLGIKTLLGRGSSTYRGSIASRIHNIGVAASRFRGILVKPGEILSFNQILGDVSLFTGYKQAYIIKDGQTVLGDGGGVCQVSTTLFRAILDAGLPIVERRAHSYRVGYYEQNSPIGLDATVYYPTTDLKFKNNTPNHLLIQSYYNPKALTLDFEIYGTDDGRVATITKPVITKTTPPPEDLYTDDPTLPLGTIKQIDYKAWGANVYFKYLVEKEGETLYEKTFYSNYTPWQAKFLRGTGPSI